MNTADWLLVAAGWFACLIWLDRTLRLHRYLLHHPPLREDPQSGGDPGAAPVCAVVAACNEAGAIEACLRSLVSQDYPGMQVIAVDDRSTDETGAIMERVAAESDRLTVLRITALPAGWIGKCHAYARAVELPVAAASEFLIFTDGDVIFASDCVRRALALVHARGLDQICLAPQLITHSFFERATCSFFGLCLLLYSKAWNVPNPLAPASYTGIGAFNLVRRSLYRSAGGHERLRLEVLDDLKLGKLMKQAGARCELRDSDGALRVRWQEGWVGVINGLEKNAFGSFRYSLGRLVANLVLFIVLFLAPPVLALALPGMPRWGWVATLALQWAALAWASRSFLVGLTFPFGAAVMLWATLRSAAITLRQGGVRWRDAFYSLADLRRGQV